MFNSFFLAGYDCTATYNVNREWINNTSATQHDHFLDHDYYLLNSVGIRAVREGICWSRVDSNGKYDFTPLSRLLDASKRHNIEVIYDLCHFGYPDGLDIFSAEFTNRFADYCYAVARYISTRTDSNCAFTPINEPSYFSWAAGDEGLFRPYQKGRSFDIKVCLAKAAIAGIDAIRAACPSARIINVDPICRCVAPHDNPELQSEADIFNDVIVFQCWDMLGGRLLPELGGSRDHLGVIGMNYYWTNQWELGCPNIPLREDDCRRWPLSDLVRTAWQRYGGEVLITETSHIGEGRARWLREVTSGAEAMLSSGIPLKGICLYPILGMPAWHTKEYLPMGLWDLELYGTELRRVPHVPTLEVLREAQRLEGRQWVE